MNVVKWSSCVKEDVDGKRYFNGVYTLTTPIESQETTNNNTIKEHGHCSFVVVFDDSIIYVTFITLNEDHRGRGFGTALLYEILRDVYDNYGIKTVSLDDMSDNSRQKNNIYKKMGMYYTSTDCSMRGNLRHILYGKSVRVDKYRTLLTSLTQSESSTDTK
ncbi:putative Acyl CoA N-acetyltransferase [Yasminevirus sp. GU-2018]|uniref:Putative Acyl CoA N-acetyltransferase n=1 Tax=Yasminevirus sp. GU-2018 TaxID=2420051 RepID=A0A5K0UBP2_9VIRU|nr:putative Acyl CoA N-acetyltransferase [Yasminevirus sp. GU-2018]